jgi:PAS domain-containing protein
LLDRYHPFSYVQLTESEFFPKKFQPTNCAEGIGSKQRILVWDADFPGDLSPQKGRFSYVNSMLPNILGYEGPEELTGKSLWELIHPDDRGLVRLSMEREQAQGFQEYSRRPLFLVDDILYWRHPPKERPIKCC